MEEAALRAVVTPRLGRLYDYWVEKRGARTCPGRRDIDPLDLRWILGRLCLLEHVPEGDHFRFRLYGVEFVQKEGMDLTGRLMGEHPDPVHAARVTRLLRHIRRTARPWAGHEESTIMGRPWSYTSLLLPLAADGRTVDMVLAGTEFFV